MKKVFYLLICLSLPLGNLQAQNVTITPGGITPAQTGSYPRINYDAILALPNPAKGDMAYDITFDCLRVYNGKKWLCTYQNPGNPTPNITALSSGYGTGEVFGRRNAVDALGNVYVVGDFKGTATFGSTTKTSSGDEDIFVAKYTSSGTLQWIQTAGGYDSDYGRDIAVDASGNVYITGLFWSRANFSGTYKNSAGYGDAYVAKYNSSGTFQWVQTAGGNGGDGSNGVAVDASGSVFITGCFANTANFNGSSVSSAGDYDVFLAKYNDAGTLQWVQSGGGTYEDIGQSIAIDASGYIYITGSIVGTVNFGSISEVSYGSFDAFVAKFDPFSTSWAWVKAAGGSDTDYAYDIAADASGNVYVTGIFWGWANFDYASKISLGYSDVFIAKYNSSGFLQWVQIIGSTGTEYGYGIALDGAGNVYATGAFIAPINFGNVSQTSMGGLDVYVVKYNNNGAFQWVQSGGSPSADTGYGIAADALSNVYVTGYYNENATFGVSTVTSTNNKLGMFLARLEK